MTERRRIWMLLVVALMVFAALGATLPSRAQESTPDTDDPGIETTRTTREEPTATVDPAEADTESAEEPADDEAGSEGEPGGPEGDIEPGQELVIAQGLAVYDEFDEGKWWLTEIEPLGADAAGSTSAPAFGFLLQIEGTTIIRNDVTGKRARVEPGEAYYFSAGDAYTRYADGSGSRAWLLEIVPADSDEDDAAGDVRYTSDPFDDLPSSVRDFELTAGTLAQGESVDVPEGDAPSLVVLVSGRLTFPDSPPLKTPAGFAFPESVTLTNEEAADARYYVATLSSEVVSDEAPAAAEPTADDASDAAADADADADGTPAAADPDEAAEDGDTSDDWLIENDGTDTDGDTIPDDVETAIGTDPENPDTDSDGLKDWEELNFTSPLFADSDGDGWDDYEEAITYGTDPNDPNDFPAE